MEIFTLGQLVKSMMELMPFFSLMITSHLKYTIQRRKSRTGKEEEFLNDEDGASISLSIVTSSLKLFHTIEDFSEERNQIWANFQRLPSEKEFILEALGMIKGRNKIGKT